MADEGDAVVKRQVHPPIASSACPICGEDTPHAHGPNDICTWLQNQAARFNLKVEIFDKSEHKEHIEYLKSVRGQFRKFIEDMGTLKTMDFAWQLWCESLEGKAALGRIERLVYAFKQVRADLALQSGTWSNAASYGLRPEDIGLEQDQMPALTKGRSE